MRRTARILPAAMAASLLLTACGLGRPSDDGRIEHPTGDETVLRVEHVGGFAPVEFLFTGMPVFTLLGDGRVITQGAQIDIFPGPALPAVQVRRLTEQGLQAVLRAVADSGQFVGDAEWRGAQNFVADAGDTVFTLRAEGREVTITVHALGAFLPGEGQPGVSGEELAAHEALGTLLERLTMLETTLPATAWAEPTARDYVPDGLRLLVRNADADPPDDSGIASTEIAWPLEGDPADFGQPALDGYRCGAVTGADAGAWYEALAAANQLTRWTGGGHRYQVTPRLLLPGEELACPEPA
ncbi:MAG TPA: hypothetical protein VHK28_04200 [Candidatus Limnocylindria bacterium]|nr:hypothetical protein [Candidatus Limnocylindria bacterium]